MGRSLLNLVPGYNVCFSIAQWFFQSFIKLLVWASENPHVLCTIVYFTVNQIYAHQLIIEILAHAHKIFMRIN